MEELQSIKQFNEQLNQGDVIAMFTADWCPDCRVIDPILPEIEAQFTNYNFISIDRDEFMELAQQYDIFGIPSFIVFKEGQEVGRFVSKDRKTKEEITQFIEQFS